MNNPLISREVLNDAAAAVLQILKSIDAFQDAEIVVIGGLAQWEHLREAEGRATRDVDFLISIQEAPQAVKSKLLELPKTPFIERAQLFMYKTLIGQNIQIDILPLWQSPFMPSAAMKLRDISAGMVPYISVEELIVFKMGSCGMRPTKEKSMVDADDARMLVELATRNGPLGISSDLRKMVEPRIEDVVNNGSESVEWWRAKLGLPALQKK